MKEQLEKKGINSARIALFMRRNFQLIKTEEDLLVSLKIESKEVQLNYHGKTAPVRWVWLAGVLSFAERRLKTRSTGRERDNHSICQNRFAIIEEQKTVDNRRKTASSSSSSELAETKYPFFISHLSLSIQSEFSSLRRRGRCAISLLLPENKSKRKKSHQRKFDRSIIE